VPGQDQGPNRQSILAQSLENASAVKHRHCEVDHYGIGPLFFSPPQRFRPVGHFARKFQSLIRTNRAGEVLTYERVIVSN
jgi:hypothetical protein